MGRKFIDHLSPQERSRLNKIRYYSRVYGRKFTIEDIEEFKEAKKKQTEENKKAYLLNYMKTYVKKNPNIKVGNILRQRIWSLLKGRDTNLSIQEIIGCTGKELKLHLEKQFKEGMTWDNWGVKGWHIDHIKPCALFDLTKDSELKKCFHYTNLQPLWATHNLKKGKKYALN